MKINLKDVEFQAFSGSGPGGQKRNKCQCCIRAIHLPTGLRAISTSEKSQTANKKAAVEILQEKLDKLIKEKKDAIATEEYRAKASPSFGSQVRTYRLCGNSQGIVDHRTGIFGNLNVLFKGELDIFLKPERN